jgi:hypothetical protein
MRSHKLFVAASSTVVLGLPKDTVKGALCASGMYELRPVSLSVRRTYVNFTAQTVEALSPQSRQPVRGYSVERSCGRCRCHLPDRPCSVIPAPVQRGELPALARHHR